VKIKFYLSTSGRSPVEEFIADASLEIRHKFFDAVSLLAQGRALAMPLSRNLSSIHPGLHELRLKDRTGQVRVFYFMKKQDAIYIVHGIRKKTRRIPDKDIQLMLKRLKEV